MQVSSKGSCFSDDKLLFYPLPGSVPRPLEQRCVAGPHQGLSRKSRQVSGVEAWVIYSNLARGVREDAATFIGVLK
ncbi:hypothetical protein LJR066_000712 [Acidovorax sp. LjRoot66]|uniref:hypothetical protein n=1 Tax=Acidovorax sp. LjRoot66 TaxID=3342334 RepID=UPI003ECDA770